MASDLASHQIMQHNKIIHVLKVASCYFLGGVSGETKFEAHTTSIILSYLHHFGDVKKKLFRYCSFSAY